MVLQAWSGVGEVGLGVVDGVVVIGVSAEMETKTLKQMPKKQDKIDQFSTLATPPPLLFTPFKLFFFFFAMGSTHQLLTT